VGGTGGPGLRRPRVFINYRRDDSAGYAGRLYDYLVGELGDNNVFMDIDTIRLGTDFTKELDRALAAADVCLAVIGPEWLSAADRQGKRRLERSDDFVRQELERVLDRDDVMLIPVLVHGAEMPTADDLPSSLTPLAFRQALELSDRRWRSDVGQLITELETRTEQDVKPHRVERADRVDRSRPSAGFSALLRTRQALVILATALAALVIAGGVALATHGGSTTTTTSATTRTSTTGTTPPPPPHSNAVLTSSFATDEQPRWYEGPAAGSPSPGREQYVDGGYRIVAAHGKTVYAYPPGNARTVADGVVVDVTMRFTETFLMVGGVSCAMSGTQQQFQAVLESTATGPSGTWTLYRYDGGPATSLAIGQLDASVGQQNGADRVHLECAVTSPGHAHLTLSLNGVNVAETDQPIATQTVWAVGLVALLPDQVNPAIPEGAVTFDDFSLKRPS